MSRIAGVDLPRNKRIEVALTYLYGIGISRSRQALSAAGINPDKKVSELTEDESARLRSFIEARYIIEGDLRREVSSNLQRLIAINCYRGLRHRRGLPVRGQRTRRNARTRRGTRRTVGVVRRTR